MKKNIIALAVASAIAAPVAMADAPVVYGKFNVNINSVTEKGNGVNDTASRLGIKGSEDLGNGLKAIYKYEMSVDLEGSGGIGNRNQYLGLAGGFGTVLIGQHDSPMKMAQPTDTFNDGAADNSKLGMGEGGKTGEIRATEVLAYVSPSFGGVKLILAGTSPSVSKTKEEAIYVSSDGTVTNTKPTSGNYATINYEVTNNNDSNDRSIFGGTHAAVTYGSTKKGLFLSAAMDSFGKKSYGMTKDYNQTSFSAQYKTGGLTVNGTVRTFDDGKSGVDGSDEGTANIINAAYKMGKFTVKGKIMQADYAESGLDTGTQTAIGVAYALGKKTTAYVYTTTQDKDLVNKGDNAGTKKAVTSSFVGMVHKF
jgi:predicted porin